MTRVNLCSVKLNQALSATAEVAKVVVPLLEGKAMKPRLIISLGKQIWVVRYTAVIVKVATHLLRGEAMKLLLSLCCASLR